MTANQLRSGSRWKWKNAAAESTHQTQPQFQSPVPLCFHLVEVSSSARRRENAQTITVTQPTSRKVPAAKIEIMIQTGSPLSLGSSAGGGGGGGVEPYLIVSFPRRMKNPSARTYSTGRNRKRWSRLVLTTADAWLRMVLRLSRALVACLPVEILTLPPGGAHGIDRGDTAAGAA